MNLLRFQSVFALCVLFLIFGYDQVRSAPPSNITEGDQNSCDSSCYESLKEQIKVKTQEQIVRDNENRELRQKVLDFSNNKENSEALKDKNNCEKTKENLKINANDLNECISYRENLKKEIELERKNAIEIEKKFKLDLEQLKKEKNELETKSSKDFADHKSKEESLSNELKDLKLQVSLYKEKLKESETQLADKIRLAERSSFKLNQSESNTIDCKESIKLISKTGCKGLHSGIHRIAIDEDYSFLALCDADTIYDGEWLVIQKRFDGSENFNKKWTSYRNGFGELDGEFFIGLQKLYRITNSQRYELLVRIKDFNEKVWIAMYDNFKIGNENEKYELQSIGEYGGTAGDHLQWSIGGKFTTVDHDNDYDEDLNLAVEYYGGWWYKFGAPNPNSRYFDHSVYATDSMQWYLRAIQSVEMLIRPKSN